MTVQKLIDKFEKLTFDLYSEDDLNRKNKIDDKIAALVDTVYEMGEEREFYSYLFNSSNPLTLVHIAFISDNRNYDIFKSFEIFKYIRSNALSLVFLPDEIKNERLKNYFSKLSTTNIEQKIEFYNELNDDYLFKRYYDYLSLCCEYYNCYAWSKDKDKDIYWDKITCLIEDIKKKGLERFISIVFEKSKKMESKVVLIVHCFLCVTLGYQKDYAKRQIEIILKDERSSLNPKMLKFTESFFVK